MTLNLFYPTKIAVEFAHSTIIQFLAPCLFRSCIEAYSLLLHGLGCSTAHIVYKYCDGVPNVVAILEEGSLERKVRGNKIQWVFDP